MPIKKEFKKKYNKYQVAAIEVTKVMGWEIDDQGSTIDVDNWTDQEIIVELKKAANAREPQDEFSEQTTELLDELASEPEEVEEVVPVVKAEKPKAKFQSEVSKKSTELLEELASEPEEVSPKAEVKKGKAPVKKEVPQTPAPKAEVKKPAPAKVEPKKEVAKKGKKVDKKVEKKAPAPAKVKKDDGPKTRKPREQKTVNHAMMLVRELVVKNPDISIPELESELAKAGYTGVHKNSIVVRRMEMRHCLTVMNKLGLLKKNK